MLCNCHTFHAYLIRSTFSDIQLYTSNIIILLMALSSHTFLIVAVLGIIAMVNNAEPISELTFTLIAFIIPGTMLMSFYMSGDINRVLNRTKDKDNHGSEHNEDTNI